MRYSLSTHINLTDEELIGRAQVGDELAFAELMSRYDQRIWKVITANSRQPRDAEEILMDVWRAVWENISGLRRVESFGGWVHRIAYNACKRYYAAVGRSGNDIPCSDTDLTERIDQDAVARFRERERYDYVREVVHHLPDKVRRVAVLYYLELWSVNEIHAELGLAIGTIKTKLRQTRELLRKEFDVELERGETMSSKQEKSKHIQPRIKVIGVGGAGGNAVKHMIEAGLTGIEFYAVNIDQQALDKHREATTMLIGANTTPGFSGSNPEIGRKAVEEDRETIRAIVADADIVFIVAGMGGGTGTGAAPLIASVAQERGAVALGVVTCPFNFEGQRRAEQAKHGMQKLQENADAVVVVQNQGLLDSIEAKQKLPITIREAFHLSDEMLRRSVERSISDLHSSTLP